MVKSGKYYYCFNFFNFKQIFHHFHMTLCRKIGVSTSFQLPGKSDLGEKKNLQNYYTFNFEFNSLLKKKKSFENLSKSQLPAGQNSEMCS